MSCLVAICGRYGDIMMAVPTLKKLSYDNFGDIDIVVATPYKNVSILLHSVAACVRKVRTEPIMCPTRDKIVTGMFMSSWSDDLLRRRYPGYDQYINAAPNMAIKGVHMISLISYKCGIISSVLDFPEIKVPDRDNEGPLVVHLGSNDPDRIVCLSENPIPERKSICVGLPNEPCPIWIDEDCRSESFKETLEIIDSAGMVVGSDSLFSHVSCLMGIPTVCIHTSQKGYSMYSRGVYPTGVSTVADRGLADPIVVRTKLLNLSDQENFNVCSDRQGKERMEFYP